MGCLSVEYERKGGCLSVEYERKGGDLVSGFDREGGRAAVTFALECGNSFGIPLLFDVDSRQLFDINGELLIANY